MKSGVKERFRITNPLLRECFAEFVGTFILLAVTCGSAAQQRFGQTLGLDPLPIKFVPIFAGGLGPAMGIWVSGGVSGGHINPAVTLAFATTGVFPWYKVIPYLLAQYLGAILAPACVYGVYYEAFQTHCNGTKVTLKPSTCDTAAIFATYPVDYLSTVGGVIDQVFGTGMLLLIISGLVDDRGWKPPNGLFPICVSTVVWSVTMSFGLNCGSALNPARDLGPRIFTAIAGWGDAPFSLRNYNWFWVPVVAPHIGGILGTWIYTILIGMHYPPQEQEDKLNKYPDLHENRTVIANGIQTSNKNEYINIAFVGKEFQGKEEHTQTSCYL